MNIVLVIESRQVSLPLHRPAGARHWLGRWLWRDSGEKKLGYITDVPLDREEMEEQTNANVIEKNPESYPSEGPDAGTDVSAELSPMKPE